MTVSWLLSWLRITESVNIIYSTLVMKLRFSREKRISLKLPLTTISSYLNSFYTLHTLYASVFLALGSNCSLIDELT
jgi:hypothetical protein